ncbi:MAG: hypothetical protein ACREN6_10385 [Gemmatimonadaceae bacterium]
MLVLSTTRIADALRDGRLTERAKVQIIGIGTACTMLVSGQGILAGRTYGDIALGFIFVAIAILGIRRCYRINGGAAGHAFAERYLCLAVPVGVWIYGAYYLLYVGSYNVLRVRSGIDGGTFAAATHPYVIVTGFAAIVLYFGVLGRCFRRILAASPTHRA